MENIKSISKESQNGGLMTFEEFERMELEEQIQAKGNDWAESFYEFERKIKNLSPEQLDQVFELLRNYQADPQAYEEI